MTPQLCSDLLSSSARVTSLLESQVSICDMKDLENHFCFLLALPPALTTWCDGLRRCLRAGRSHHHSNRGTGPWARSLPSHPGRALVGRSSPPSRPRCIPRPGGTGSGRSGCRGSHTAGTPGPVGSSVLRERERETLR